MKKSTGTNFAGVRAGWVLLAAVFLAAVPAAAAGDDRVSEVHGLGAADPQAAYELVQGLLSTEGRAVLDEGHNSLIVLDTPERQEAVRETLAALRGQGPLPNVRVETRMVDRETGKEVLIDLSGQLIVPYPGAGAGAALTFNADARESGENRTSKQFVVVSSGGEASISIGKEIPYQQWFFTYGRRQGIITRETVWRSVGSRLAVRPTVVEGGRAVRLRVVPEFDYTLPGGGRKGKKAGKESLAFTAAATELVVPTGEEVLIGGGEEQNDFYSRFLVGYDRQRRVRRVDIYLRASVMEAGPAPGR